MKRLSLIHGERYSKGIFEILKILKQKKNIADVITKDNLNAVVDLVVYFKIKKDEQSVKNSVYEVNDVQDQLETLARTTARNVIGTMPFSEVNSERKVLNEKLQAILVTETKNWGVEVLKVELKDITPPRDVQSQFVRRGCERTVLRSPSAPPGTRWKRS